MKRRDRWVIGAGVLLAAAAMAYVPARVMGAAKQREALWQSRWSELRARPASLERYRDDDARLRAAGAAPGRVVFLGASVTEAFDLAQRFPGAPFVNRGVSGQLLWQEYLRLDDDVLSLRPDAIVPEVCATNFDRHAPSLAQTQRWYTLLIERARDRGVHPVVATVIPVTRAYAQEEGGSEMPAHIAAMNAWLRDYARTHGDPLVDWAAALGDRDGNLRNEFTTDGLHPNDLGYARMTDAVRVALMHR
jgi:lysophospholipase L1-like esterase